MLRVFFWVGLIAVVALGLIGLVFGGVLALFWLLLRIFAIGIVVYFVIRLVSPKTAAAIRDKFEKRPGAGW